MVKTAHPRSRRSASPPDLRAVFRRRTNALLDRLLDQAADEVIASALEAPTDVGGLFRLLNEMAPLEDTAEEMDPFAEAIARGAEIKKELLGDAGGGWTSSRVAKHLGITRQAVDKRRKKLQLLAVPTGSGEYRYPVCQFTETGVLPGLGRFLRSFTTGNGWVWLDRMLTPAEEIRGISPLQALRDGDSESAAIVAAMYGELGGPAEPAD